MILYQWAERHKIPMTALKELETLFGVEQHIGASRTDRSEAAILNDLRLESSREGIRLFRNNVGGGTLADGSFVRWGLANESKAVNSVIKSADLIGIKPVVIKQSMVGATFGQFISREAKAGDWTYSGTERELAQLRWIQLVASLGGDAKFANGAGSFE